MMTRLAVAVLVLGGEISAGLGTEISAREPPQAVTVRVVVPATVTFNVPEVSTSSPANAPATVSFDQAALGVGKVLRVSVKADGDLTMSGSPSVSVANISWTTASVTNGIGVNGVLSRSVYSTVFQGQLGTTSGTVTLNWTLAALGTSIRAGTRQATLRWRFEAITP